MAATRPRIRQEVIAKWRAVAKRFLGIIPSASSTATANGVNSNQLGRTNVAAPAASPPQRPKNAACAVVRDLQAIVQSTSCNSINGQKGASLRISALSATAPG